MKFDTLMTTFELLDTDMDIEVRWVSSGSKLIYNYTMNFIDWETIFINCTGSETMLGLKNEKITIKFNRPWFKSITGVTLRTESVEDYLNFYLYIEPYIEKAKEAIDRTL